MDSIVVGVDGSEGARAALAFAAHEAALRGAKLRIVSTWVVAPAAHEVASAPETGVAKLLHGVAQRACDDALAEAKRLEPAVDCETRALEGNPSVVLIDEAERAALLVVGSRGHGGFATLLVGSVSQQCAQHAPCPVAIVPRPESSADIDKGTIVVGSDGSDESKAALRWALDEARARQAKLVCVHAWLFPSFADPSGAAAGLAGGMFATLREEAVELLENAIADVRTESDAGVEIEQSVVEGPPASVLIAAADLADLLVVGSRGLGGFRGLLLGSVSQQCAHHASCPIVIVRTHTPD